MKMRMKVKLNPDHEKTLDELRETLKRADDLLGHLRLYLDEILIPVGVEDEDVNDQPSSDM